MTRSSPATACEYSKAASVLSFNGASAGPEVSLLKATKPPVETGKTNCRFAGLCAATAMARHCKQSRRARVLLLIRGTSLDHGQFHFFSRFEPLETGERRIVPRSNLCSF